MQAIRTNNVYPLYGDAGSGTRLTPYVRLSESERATAYNIIRNAGGMTLDTQDGVIQSLKKFVMIPYDIGAKTGDWVTQYNPYALGKKSGEEIKQVFQNNPELFNGIANGLKKAWDLFYNPIKSTSLLITMFPYMLVAGLGIAAFYAFKNPGSVSLPKKISLT